MELFGRYDVTGIHDDEYEPVPDIQYEDRKTSFDVITKKFASRLSELDRK